MNPISTSSQRQLLALVKASLWQKPVNTDAFMSGAVDWNMIGRLAIDQAVGGLAFEAAMTLPDNLLPPKEWIRKAIAFIETNRRTHIHVNKCVAEAAERLRGEGIEPILLKGQAYASLYPRPEMRQCGDIDLYVGEENYYAAYSAVNKFGWDGEQGFKPEEKHYVCMLGGVNVELHRVAAKLIPKSLDQKFQLWSRNQLSSSDRSVFMEDVNISIPTPVFDVIFVFHHLYHHFLNGGIGLRHICDWVLLIHAHSKEIDYDELYSLLKSFRLLEAWKSFAPIPVLFMGLPESECPFYSGKYVKSAERVLLTILEEGNFGRAKGYGSMRPKGYLAGKLHSVRVVGRKYLKKFRYDPRRIILLFGSFILGGTFRVLKDMMKGGGK